MQYIPYGDDQSIKFPVEVLVTNKGVCSEKSFLLAGILYYAGYDVALLDFEKENHMAVGIKGNCSKSYGGYCFIETTRPNPIRYVPKTYVGNITLKSKLRIIKIGNNSLKYNKIYNENISRYKQEIVERIKDYIIKRLDLKYDEKLTKKIDNNEKYLPRKYHLGCTYYYSLEFGSPKMICAEIIPKIEKDIKDSDPNCLKYTNSKAFGIDIIYYYKNNEPWLAIDVAK